MANPIARQDDMLKIPIRDRAFRVAKKLVAILRDECNQPKTWLHMAQESVAAGLSFRSIHGTSASNFPR